MQEQSILHYIRKRELKRIIFPLLFLLFVFVILINQPLFEYLKVTDINSTTSLAVAVNQDQTYVRTTGDNLYYTGSDYYQNGALTGHYYYQLSDHYCRFYVLNPTPGKPAVPFISHAEIVGKLEKLDTDTDQLLSNMASNLNWSITGLSGICDPYLVNEVVYFTMSERILFAAVIIAFVLGLIGLIKILLLLLFPKLSITYRRLKDYGDPDQILKDAENELNYHCILKQGNMVLTPKYLFEFSSLSAIIPLESVLWVYQLQNMKYSFKERREKMVYTLRIITIAGDTFSLKDKRKEDLDKVSEVLTERYPNFFYGYSEDHDKMVHYILEENRRELKNKDDSTSF